MAGNNIAATSVHKLRTPSNYKCSHTYMAGANWCGTIQIGHIKDSLDTKYDDPQSIEEAGVRYLMDLKLIHGNVQYSCWQVERGNGGGDGDGRVHVQAYVELKRGRNLEWLCQQLCNGHWKPRRGPQEAAIAYCKKDDTRVEGGGPHEYGEPKAQGRRNDLRAVAECIENGLSFEDILERYPEEALKYTNNITTCMAMKQKVRTEMPYVKWIWGRTGIGKTASIYDMHGYEHVYTKRKDTKSDYWWDGYDQNKHQAILIDDINPDNWTKTELLNLLDRYPYRGQCKGLRGGVQINSPFIYITSSFNPLSLPDNIMNDEMRRRIACIEHKEIAVKREVPSGLTRDDPIDIE